MRSRLQMHLLDLLEAVKRLGSVLADGLRWWFEGTRQIGSQFRDGLFLIGKGLLLIILFPWHLVRFLLGGVKRLSGTGKAVERSVSSVGKSVRGSVIDLQESIEAQPDVLKGRWQRLRTWSGHWFRARPPWQRHALRAGLVMSFLLLASAYPAWRWFKSWRAEQFITEAQQLLDEGRPLEAYFKGQAAYNLIPGDPSVLTELIEIARNVRHPNTLQWGQQLVDQGFASARTVATLAEIAQSERELALARAYVSRLERIDPSHPDLPLLRTQVLLQRGDRGAALDLTATLVESPAVDPRVARIFFGLSLESEDPDWRKQGREALKRFALERSPRGLVAAVRLLAEASESEDPGPFQLAEAILSHPDAGRSERLRAYAAQAEFGLEDWDSLQSKVRDVFDLESNDGRFGYATWLFQLKRYEALIEAFPAEVVNESRELYTLETLALMFSGREQMALERLRSADAFVVPELERLILESRVLRELGQENAYVSTVERVIARADETQFQLVERLLGQLGEQRFLVSLYKKFASIPSTSARSNANLLIYAYRNGDTALLTEVASRSRVESFNATPVAQGLLAYFKGLTGVQSEEDIRAVEGLVSRYPAVLDFRVALAVNYLRQGYLADAGAILAETGMAPLSELPGMYAVSFAILESVGTVPPDLPIPEATSASMLPQEKAFIQDLETSS